MFLFDVLTPKKERHNFSLARGKEENRQRGVVGRSHYLLRRQHTHLPIFWRRKLASQIHDVELIERYESLCLFDTNCRT